MVPQASQPHLHNIVYKMAATTQPITLKGGVERLGSIAPTIDDDCKEVHMQTKQLALLQQLPVHNNSTISQNLEKEQKSACD